MRDSAEAESRGLIPPSAGQTPEGVAYGAATPLPRAFTTKDELGWAIDRVARADLDEVIAFTLPENRASVRVMEKLGLEHRGTTEWSGQEHIWYSVGRRPR